jgi:uncharacterized protein (TIGR02265 family)
MTSPSVHESLRGLSSGLPSSQRVTFGSVFDGLFLKAFAKDVTPEFRARLKGLGVDLEHLHAGYPFTVFVDVVGLTAETFFPNLTKEEAWFQIGVRNLEGFYDTFLGKPMFALLRIIGPQRTAARMKANFRSANNYSESKLVELGPRELQMWMNDSGLMRFFIAGVMHRGLQLAGAKDVKLEVLATDAEGTVYRITW